MADVEGTEVMKIAKDAGGAREKPLDLRIQRTYAMLCDAFARLLETHRYEEISVSDLCNAATVRRTTFYKHFADKGEFFSFYVLTKRDEFRRASAPHVVGAGGVESTLRMSEELISFLLANERLADGIMESRMLGTLLGTLEDVIERDIALSMAGKQKTEPTDGREARGTDDYLAAFYAGGILQAIQRWWPQRKTDPHGLRVAAAIKRAFAA